MKTGLTGRTWHKPRTPLSNAFGRKLGSSPGYAQAAAPSGVQGNTRAAASPPPLWGRDRVGGNPKPQGPGFPAPLAPPRVMSKTCLRHDGEGTNAEFVAAAHPLLRRASVVAARLVGGDPRHPGQPADLLPLHRPHPLLHLDRGDGALPVHL